jgi:predicted nucleic acid-binding protein
MADPISLLDTSALLTFIEDEEGADRVEQLLKRPETLVTWVSLLEIYYITMQERGETEAVQRHELLNALPVTLVHNVDENILIEAARIKAKHKVSFADAIIAACAFCHGATIVHKDPEFEQLSGLLKFEALPYKK